MKKFKKIWNENRILFILAIVLITCLIIIGVVSLVYFYGSSSTPYGNRLDATKDTPIKDANLKDIESHLTSNEKVGKATAILKGRIIYITIDFTDKTTLDKAKSIAEESLTKLSEEQLAVYDVIFTISHSKTTDFEGYNLMGARNTNGSGHVVWSNNTKIVEEGSNE